MAKTSFDPKASKKTKQPAKKKPKLDSKKLRKLITAAAKRAFTEVREAHRDEDFYAFALYTDDGLMTVMPSANTEQGYQRAVKKYGFKKRQEKSYVRWATAEWAYEGVGADAFNQVCDLINGQEIDDMSAKANYVIGSMVGALKALDDKGVFGKGEARKKITVFVSISDSDDAEGIENKSAEMLNPPAVFAEFQKR
jgi:hypothetical protein